MIGNIRGKTGYVLSLKGTLTDGKSSHDENNELK